MMTLLRGLHSIAAKRGDGLRPELLRIITPSPTWAGVERMGYATIVEDTDVKPVGCHQRREIDHKPLV